MLQRGRLPGKGVLIQLLRFKGEEAMVCMDGVRRRV